MSRPIVLPELPIGMLWDRGAVLEVARAAVEADRKGIVVTEEDVEEAIGLGTRGALESFAKRLRGEAP